MNAISPKIFSSEFQNKDRQILIIMTMFHWRFSNLNTVFVHSLATLHNEWQWFYSVFTHKIISMTFFSPAERADWKREKELYIGKSDEWSHLMCTMLKMHFNLTRTMRNRQVIRNTGWYVFTYTQIDNIEISQCNIKSWSCPTVNSTVFTLPYISA